MKQELIIEADRAERQYWRDLWSYRELFYFLAWRNILVRYKQTMVGVAWAVMRPVLSMIILTIVFGKIAGMGSGGVPHPILVFSALLPWQFFAAAVQDSGGSLVQNASMVSKVYFPRLAIPTSSVVTSLVDFFISCAIFCVVLVIYQFLPSGNVWALPIFVVMAFLASLSAGLWISALMVRYRDFRFIVPFIVQFGLYITPVAYMSSAVPEKMRFWYSLNPMVGVIDGFRWALFGGEHQIYWPGMWVSICVILLALFTGVKYFRSTERTFADVI